MPTKGKQGFPTFLSWMGDGVLERRVIMLDVSRHRQCPRSKGWKFVAWRSSQSRVDTPSPLRCLQHLNSSTSINLRLTHQHRDKSTSTYFSTYLQRLDKSASTYSAAWWSVPPQKAPWDIPNVDLFRLFHMLDVDLSLGVWQIATKDKQGFTTFLSWRGMVC